MNEPVVVIGDGWAACALAGWLGAQGTSVRWLTGSGSRLMAPLPFMAASDGGSIWSQLASALGVDTGEMRKGSFLREFRSKGFREPVWTQAPTPADREDVFKESLWEPERRLVGFFEERFESISLMDLEEAFRAKIAALPQVTRREGVPMSLAWEKDEGTLVLGTGEKTTFRKLFYADRLDSLGEIGGLPKALTGRSQKLKLTEIEKKLSPYGALQLVLHHEPQVGGQVTEGFMLELTRESGEEVQRHVFGGFFAGGAKSSWTVVLSPEELADNHQIARRLRRVKQSLAKVFPGPEWLGPNHREFMDTVTSETVRLEDSVLFAEGDPGNLPMAWEGTGVTFLSDGYGPSWALSQVGRALGLLAHQGTEPQTEGMNLARSSHS